MGGGRRTSCAAAAVWSVVFAAPHLYWAAGGRRGLGSETAAADRALSSPGFTAYNAGTAVLAVAATVLAVALLRWSPRGRLLGGVVVVVSTAAVVLGLRGVLGVVLLLVGAVRGDPWPPPVLTAIEPWFVLGAVAWGAVARTLRRDGP